MQSYINFNGSLLEADTAVVPAQNRGLRYGDGLFETIKVIDERIVLEQLHFDRLFSGMKALRFDVPAWFTPGFLRDAILQLCRKNGVQSAARVRLNTFRKNGSLYEVLDLQPQFIIEANSLIVSQSASKNACIIGVYKEARKGCDAFSQLKSNNYLPYVMAALHARQQGWNDCLVMNTEERVCDSTIANVFCIQKDGTIFTPPLTEGGVAGIMRRYLLQTLPSAGICIKELPITLSDLQQAEEIFLTNAIYGIRSVKMFGERSYKNEMTTGLFDQFVKKLNDYRFE